MYKQKSAKSGPARLCVHSDIHWGADRGKPTCLAPSIQDRHGWLCKEHLAELDQVWQRNHKQDTDLNAIDDAIIAGILQTDAQRIEAATVVITRYGAVEPAYTKIMVD